MDSKTKSKLVAGSEPSYGNKPYVKVFIGGVLINPITADKPYMHMFPSTSRIKAIMKQPKNNKAGARVLITNMGGGVFTKTHVKTQIIPAKHVYKLEEGAVGIDGKVFRPRRVLTHYEIKNL